MELINNTDNRNTNLLDWTSIFTLDDGSNNTLVVRMDIGEVIPIAWNLELIPPT